MDLQLYLRSIPLPDLDRLKTAASYLVVQNPHDPHIRCSITRLNPRQLNSLFRREFHQSATEYISGRRISRAKELLYFSSCSVTEIAEQCGFKTVHYFSRVFKEKTGRSPGEYRRSRP